jgi:hypothetical protein
MFIFGAGNLYGIPQTDAAGVAIANPTPVKFGTLQNVSIDWSFENKSLYGQKQFPVAVGRGKGKVSGKAQIGNLNGKLINSLFFGQTLTANVLVGIYNGDAGSVIPTTPFTITMSPPGSGTYKRDLGVLDANGNNMTRVASGPVTGQYSVNEGTGVYTFASADTGLTVFPHYEYEIASSPGAGKSIVTNQLMGYAPKFALELSTPYDGKQFSAYFYSAISSKLSFSTKQDDFLISDFDFDCFVNAAGNLCQYSISD